MGAVVRRDGNLRVLAFAAGQDDLRVGEVDVGVPGCGEGVNFVEAKGVGEGNIVSGGFAGADDVASRGDVGVDVVRDGDHNVLLENELFVSVGEVDVEVVSAG